MKCYLCDVNVKSKSPNLKKEGGIWIHKLCPAEAARRKQRRKAKRARNELSVGS